MTKVKIAKTRKVRSETTPTYQVRETHRVEETPPSLARLVRDLVNVEREIVSTLGGLDGHQSAEYVNKELVTLDKLMVSLRTITQTLASMHDAQEA